MFGPHKEGRCYLNSKLLKLHLEFFNFSAQTVNHCIPVRVKDFGYVKKSWRIAHLCSLVLNDGLIAICVLAWELRPIGQCVVRSFALRRKGVSGIRMEESGAFVCNSRQAAVMIDQWACRWPPNRLENPFAEVSRRRASHGCAIRIDAKSLAGSI